MRSRGGPDCWASPRPRYPARQPGYARVGMLLAVGSARRAGRSITTVGPVSARSGLPGRNSGPIEGNTDSGHGPAATLPSRRDGGHSFLLPAWHRARAGGESSVAHRAAYQPCLLSVAAWSLRVP